MPDPAFASPVYFESYPGSSKYNLFDNISYAQLFSLPMHSKFGFLSYEISHIIRQRFNKEAENSGLTHAQWRALVHLSNNENCRQIDLAEILEINPITLTRQIDLLEEAGLVRRKHRPSPHPA